MIRIAIVEDEDIYIRQLVEYIDEYRAETDEEFSVKIYRDGVELVESYKAEFDIIFLDIQMKLVDGMTTAEEIRKVDSEVAIVFVTNMVQYAVKGYEVEALDYIVKPLEYFSFSQKLKRAIERIKKRNVRYLSIHTKGGIQKIRVSDLYYVESQGHTLIFHMKNNRILEFRGAMKEWEDMMVPEGFFRIHKGYLVNLQYVEGTLENFCTVHGEQLPIGRTKKKEFMDTLVDYLHEVDV